MYTVSILQILRSRAFSATARRRSGFDSTGRKREHKKVPLCKYEDKGRGWLKRDLDNLDQPVFL